MIIEPYWDMFKVKELEKAPKWDGHTPTDAINRIASLDLKPFEFHGKWVPDYETFVDENGYESEPIQTGFFCSACGAFGHEDESYCKCCGAKMDKDGDSDDR